MWFSDCNTFSKMQATSGTERFNELFSGLEDCDEDEQRKKIEEMNEIFDGMNKEEFESVFTTRMFYKIYKMIEEKKLSIENAILLLKHVGYCDVLKNFWNPFVEKSLLNKRFEQMIIEEEKIKEEKNEKLLVDLCECYLLLNGCASSELISICVPCLLEAALKKDESEETRKEKEIALLALSHIDRYFFFRQELYLNEIKENILYHQEHHNLTQLAYQSAWEFLMNRFYFENSLKVIVNELHFGREAARELEELTRNMDWKKKEGEEMNKEEAKEEFALIRWLKTCEMYFLNCRLWNEENPGLINSIVHLYRAAKGNNGVICNLCIYSLRNAAEKRVVRVEDLLKGGAIDVFLEEMQRPKLNDNIAYECFQFFMNVSSRLKEKEDDEKEEEERKATKMETFEKLEEEGYEDTITSFYGIFELLKNKYYGDLSLSISDYLVNI
ncbi:uncharacterized protein MONOS_8004 [Monocercomonoides exilis]|uniref:uncharacterized protein n=1 Tax=Monocercomonoides exilis TaxID=2049356 RepID=UPI00355A11CE|nr:hypothetical protein MONOS_8004 [Monocercomonoides exilis]